MSTRTDYSEHRALIVGCGSIGKRHSRNLRSLGVREIAFFDVNCEAAQNLQAELDGKAFADYETALNIFKPNIALICTPPVWHVDHARMALESGAHTFIEKPLAHESTAIPALIELAKRDQRVVQVGYNLRFHPGLRILKELVDNQRIGRVLWLSAEAGQYLPDWRPTQNYRDSYTGRRAMGGGILLDGSHELDYVCWLLGRPTEVSCRADRTSKLEVDVEDSAWLRIEFPDRRWAGIHIDFVQRTYTRTCKVVGETGTALWDFASREVRWYCSENKNWNATSYSFDINDMYVEEMRHFLDCVSSGSRPMVDLEQGEAIVRLVEAAKRSSDEKRTVQIASTPERNKKITVAIIQARMGSSRLPGKSLAEIEGKPMLWHVVRRVTLATRVDRVVVATTEARQDDAIVRMCAEHDIPCYRGSEDDVLDRFYQTATAERASQIVRITADCPLIDPEVIDLVVDKFERGVFDYVSNSMIHTFPDGLDTEVFSFEALEQAWREAHKVSEREHVTPFLRSGKFRIANVENKAEFACGTRRWTVDEPRDLEFVRTVYGAFRGRDAFGMQDVLHFLRTHRECEAMNAGIVSNSGYYKSLCSDSSAESAPSRSLEKSSAWLNRAKKVIPGCSQTFSKGYNQHVKGVAPVFLESGKGCRVWDVDGNEYIDYIQGLLPNILGYANEEVNAAVSAQLRRGHSFSLPHPVEVELAERLTTLIPCAEMVRFGKNGSDATSGAVRAARAFTGKERIACCGYHGWQDWFIGSTTRNAGVPLAVRELTHNFIYNDLNSLETILEKHRNEFAAVIMEPANFTPPAAGFLEEVRNLAHKHGALLIFDEICSGFHFGLGGAQKRFGVTPDLACFGKAMGNGFPISCIVGRADFMHIFEEVFFSFTFGGEVASMAAAMTVLDILERTDAFAKIEANGRVLQEGLNTIAKEVGLQDRIKCVGYPFWSLVKFLDEKGKDSLLVRSLFAQECAKRGLLLLATHNMTAAHDAPAIEQSLKIYAATCKTVSAWLSDRQPEKYLEGDMIESVFKVR